MKQFLLLQRCITTTQSNFNIFALRFDWGIYIFRWIVTSFVVGRTNQWYTFQFFDINIFSDYVITYIELKIRHAHKWLPIWLNCVPNEHKQNISKRRGKAMMDKWWLLFSMNCLHLFSVCIERIVCCVACACAPLGAQIFQSSLEINRTKVLKSRPNDILY